MTLRIIEGKVCSDGQCEWCALHAPSDRTYCRFRWVVVDDDGTSDVDMNNVVADGFVSRQQADDFVAMMLAQPGSTVWER